MAEEECLIQQAVAGNAEAFDALIKPHLARAFRTACLITHDRPAAEDALQEAMLRAYRALGNLQPDRPFYPWFARIVVNEALKQAKRRPPYLPLHDLPSEPAETIEQHIEEREDRQHLWRAIQELTPAHRPVIVLRYYEELSEGEMAGVLDIPPGTVKSRLYHARTALETALRREHPTRSWFYINWMRREEP